MKTSVLLSGKGRTPRVERQDLAQIVVSTLSGISRLNQYKYRLLDIAEDGKISEDEYDDFGEIKGLLDKLQVSVSGLQLWLEEQMAQGELEEGSF